ncbi:MAG: gamma carbonic anhydrase family protein [Pirellulaceae bacterium]|nr:gamma carbonic anhydrase family protein [Pirellulaceae bacterium]
MTIFRLGDQAPVLEERVYVSDHAVVIGQVTLGQDTSIWPLAVLRGDNEPIRVGTGCNLQEHAVLHTDPGFPLTLGDHVTVGHHAVLHGCTVGDHTLIGIHATILNGAVIGRHCLIGAGALITQGKRFPDNSLILGVPAVVARELTADEIASLPRTAHKYVERAEFYSKNLERIS